MKVWGGERAISFPKRVLSGNIVVGAPDSNRLVLWSPESGDWRSIAGRTGVAGCVDPLRKKETLHSALCRHAGSYS